MQTQQSENIAEVVGDHVAREVQDRIPALDEVTVSDPFGTRRTFDKVSGAVCLHDQLPRHAEEVHHIGPNLFLAAKANAQPIAA